MLDFASWSQMPERQNLRKRDLFCLAIPEVLAHDDQENVHGSYEFVKQINSFMCQ